MNVEQNWTSPKFQLPPEGVVVYAIDSSGHVQELKRQGHLWFVPDGSMYVYYTPQFWKAKS